MATAAMAVPGGENAPPRELPLIHKTQHNAIFMLLGMSGAEEPVDDPVMQFFHSATAYDIMPENGKVSDHTILLSLCWTTAARYARTLCCCTGGARRWMDRAICARSSQINSTLALREHWILWQVVVVDAQLPLVQVFRIFVEQCEPPPVCSRLLQSPSPTVPS